MDPVAHTFTGMALAATGLRRATPLAATALFMGANAPDVDVLASFGPAFEQLAFRRGWTHGVLAIVVWPFVLTGVLLAWDRFVRRKRKPDAAAARAGPLLALTALAVLSHPALDWLNNYGLRWLMPFDGRWFYGDALFVIDPWFWLIVGGAAFLTFSKSLFSSARWAVFFGFATWLIFANTEIVPVTSAVLWVVGGAVLAALRWWLRDAPPLKLERAAQAGVAVGVVYLGVMIGASAAARADVRAVVAARGIEVEDVMVAPAPADPFGGEVIVMTRDEYFTGRFNWLMTPRLRLADERIARPRGAAYDRAAETPEASRYLTWARFPAAEVEPTPGGGTRVRLWDVRYADRIFGPTIELAPGAVTLGSE